MEIIEFTIPCTIEFKPEILQEQILQAMRDAGEPISINEISKRLEWLTTDRKQINNAFAKLKKNGSVVSPMRCKWQPAK
jgi:hypothetical protein